MVDTPQQTQTPTTPVAASDTTQPSLPLVVDDKGVTAGAEVELAEGGESKVVEEGAQQQPAQVDAQGQPIKPKSANRVPAAKRIGQLTAEKHHLLTENERKDQEIARLTQEVQRGNLSKQQLDASALGLAEANAKANFEVGKTRYKEALANNDPDGMATASAMMAQAKSDEQQITAYKARVAQQQPQPGQQQQPEQRQVQQPAQPAAPLNPATAAWVEANPWVNRQSPEFNAEMADALVAHASLVEKRLTREGRGNEIGTDTYYAELDRRMREDYPDELGEAEPEPQPQQRRVQQQAPRMVRQNGAAVAPGQGQSQGGASVGSNRVPLSVDDRRFVRQLVDQGAMKYPPGHKDFGKRMSYPDAEIDFARQKLANPPRGSVA